MSTFELAVNLHRAGRLSEAAASYQQLLSQQPNHADANFLLGNIALQVGQHEAAIKLYETAICANPQNAAYRINLGEALRRARRFDESARILLSAIVLQPDRVEAIYNLGLTLRDTQRFAAAVLCFECTLSLQPEALQFAEALRKTRDLAATSGATPPSTSVPLSVGQDELSCQVLVQLAKVYQVQGRHETTISLCRAALTSHPSHTPTLVMVSESLAQLGQSNEAVDHLRCALIIKPKDVELLARLATMLQAASRLEEAVGVFRQLIDIADRSELRSTVLMTLPYLPGYDAAAYLVEAREWEHNHALTLAPDTLTFENDPTPNRRLRIGYVSSNFRTHVNRHFLLPLFAHQSTNQFESFLYSDTPEPDEFSTRFRKLTDNWRDVTSLNDAQLASLVRQDRIDVLVDLEMHCERNRLRVFARKPAPIQLCWLAYAGTTGLSAMDYRIADWYLDPADGDTSVYTEQSLRLPDSFWCYDPLATEPEVNVLPALTTGVISFGSLNNYCKMNESVIDVWSRVLNTVTSSHLILYAPPGDVRRNILSAFERCGVTGDRIEFIDQVSRHEYLSTYHRIDVCLDPFPYNGGATSLDALWMGVPIVSLKGANAMARAGYSILMNLGLRELVAESHDDYVRCAASLSNDLARLAAIRAHLRDKLRESPLMDAPRFARSMEALLTRAWHTWCQRGLPEQLAAEHVREAASQR